MPPHGMRYIRAMFLSIDHGSMPSQGAKIGASDGNVCNYCPVQAVVRITPIYDQNGAAVLPGTVLDTSERIEQIRTIPNLYLISGDLNPHPSRDKHKTTWEDGFQQYKINKQGDKHVPRGSDSSTLYAKPLVSIHGGER